MLILPVSIKPADRLKSSTHMALAGACLMFIALLSSPAHASMFQGEALDNVADVMAWVVLVITPVIGITVFWLVHILPEKIAEKKKHPQAKAIQVLCLLSLAFGGLLWPLAWLWAYSKPVLHKLAYGTDVVEELEHEKKELKTAENELEILRAQVAEIQMKLAERNATLSPNSLPQGAPAGGVPAGIGGIAAQSGEKRDAGSLRESHAMGNQS